MSAQAVGGAVGHNEISIIIPCHRVVGTSGSLTGYAGGIERKVKLLELERADMTGFFVPKKGTAPDLRRSDTLHPKFVVRIFSPLWYNRRIETKRRTP